MRKAEAVASAFFMPWLLKLKNKYCIMRDMGYYKYKWKVWNMKKIKRILCLVLALAMLLCLAGCSSFERKVSKAAGLMAKEDNMRMDISLSMPIKMTVLGQGLTLDMNVSVLTEYQKDPAIIKMAMSMDGFYSDADAELYIEQDGTNQTIYLSSDGGKTWEKVSTSIEEAGKKLGKMESIAGLAVLAKNFSEIGKESVRGASATRFDGIITGELLTELASQVEVPEDYDDFLVDMADMNVSLWIDDASGKFAKMSLDLTNIVSPMLSTLFDESIEEQGLGGMGVEVSSESVVIDIFFYDYGEVGSIEIPAAARAAREVGSINLSAKG